MDLEQHLLTKLVEELMEVGKVALKIQQWRLHGKHPDHTETNKYKIHSELDDLQASIEMLNIVGLGYVPDRDRIEAKKAKVIRYAQKQEDEGTLDEFSTIQYIRHLSKVDKS